MKKIYLLVLVISQCYSVSAQPWQTMANVPVQLAFPVVVELRGNIHVIGGGGPAGASNLHLRYTPSTNTWDTLPPVPYLAQQPAGAVVNDKIHFCGGGYPTTGQRLDLHYYYDPDSVQWYQAANMPVATAIHKAVSLDGKLYVLSGQPNKTLCEYYDPASNTWTQKNPLPDMSFWYGAIESTGQTIFRFGGGGYLSPVNYAHVYDKVNDVWISLPNIPEALHAPAGTAINDSLIIFSGGYASAVIKNKVWIYNTNTQAYSSSDSLPVARDYHSMVKVDSCFYSVGGDNPADLTIGVSLIKNCSPGIATSVSSVKNEMPKPYSITITPNNFSVYLNSSVKNEQAGIKLIDISGRTILFQKINNGSIAVSAENLSDGMYIILLSAGEQSFVEQWMITR